MRLLRCRRAFSLSIREVASNSSPCDPRDAFTIAAHLLIALANAPQPSRAPDPPEAEGADHPAAWARVEREVPVRPRKVRVTAAYDEEPVEWFRAMGLGYQARMNAVLKAYMLAMKSREITSRKDVDWKGDEI
jgi:uncharacterized protein (DUF4415 family)